MKVITTGQHFFRSMIYQAFPNNWVNLYGFFFLGMEVETKI
jgi:hypothetical protein